MEERIRDAEPIHAALVFWPPPETDELTAATGAVLPNGPLPDRRCAANCDCLEPDETRAAGIAGYQVAG